MASVTAEVLSTLASRSVRPICIATSRAFVTNANEFDSDGFQATPIRSRPGSMRRASWNAFSTGGKMPCPTIYGGCLKGSARSRPTPDANGSATSVKTWRTFPSRLVLATACMDGVLDVITRS